jgi:protein-tyrosine phosphatase
MADVVLRHLADAVPLADGTTLGERLSVSSAGTGPWHEGEPMDPRARAALADAGYRDHGHVAHQFDARRFDELDLVVALDRRHQQTLLGLAGSRPVQSRVLLLRHFDARSGPPDVPDPYYGDEDEFTQCLALVEAGCRGLVGSLAAVLGRSGPVAGEPARVVEGGL